MFFFSKRRPVFLLLFFLNLGLSKKTNPTKASCSTRGLVNLKISFQPHLRKPIMNRYLNCLNRKDINETENEHLNISHEEKYFNILNVSTWQYKFVVHISNCKTTFKTKLTAKIYSLIFFHLTEYMSLKFQSDSLPEENLKISKCNNTEAYYLWHVRNGCIRLRAHTCQPQTISCIHYYCNIKKTLLFSFSSLWQDKSHKNNFAKHLKKDIISTITDLLI